MTWAYALLLCFWLHTPDKQSHSSASPRSSREHDSGRQSSTPTPASSNSKNRAAEHANPDTRASSRAPSVPNQIEPPAPISPNPSNLSSASSTSSTSHFPAEATYDAKRAREDVNMILHDHGKGYLLARERLEEHPDLAKSALSSAILSRITEPSKASPRRSGSPTGTSAQSNANPNVEHQGESKHHPQQHRSTVPTPLSSQRSATQVELKRLLTLLAVVDPDNRELGRQLAEQLRNSWQAPGKYSCEESQWCQLLVSRGPIAFADIRRLVGDRSLSTDARIELLDKLVDLAQEPDLTQLVQQVGNGDPALDLQLRRALTRRAHRKRSDMQVIRLALEQAMKKASVKQLARLVYVRSIVAPVDNALAEQFETWASTNSTDFAVRIAAVHGLRATPESQLVLANLARFFLGNLDQNPAAFELLAQAALEGLEDQQALPIIDEFQLQSFDSPRLATVGYARGTIPSDPQWFTNSQNHAWPQVRIHALSRIESHCPNTTANELKRIAGPVSRGGTKHPGIGREAVFALGRCSTPVAMIALRSLLENDAITFSRRNDAASALIEYFGRNGAEIVAALLDRTDRPEFALELALALSQAESNSLEIEQSLCGIIAQTGNEWALARKGALKSLAALTNDASCRD